MKTSISYFVKGIIVFGAVLVLTVKSAHAQQTSLPAVIGQSRYIGPMSSYYPADSLQYFIPYDSVSFDLLEGSNVPSNSIHYYRPSGWGFLERFTYAYNRLGDTSEFFTEDYNITTQAWSKSYRMSWTFDTAGKELTETIQRWQSNSNSWEGYTREEYTYDGSGYLVKTIFLKAINGGWAPQAMKTYTNNSQGNPVTMLDQLMVNNAYRNRTAKQWVYTPSGTHAIEEITQNWDTVRSAWTNFSRIQRDLTPAGKVAQERVNLWYDVNQAWDLRGYRYSYTYDNAGNMLRQLVEGNLSINSINYENYADYKYTYNSTNQPLSEIRLYANNNVFMIGRNAMWTRYYYQQTAPSSIKNTGQPNMVLTAYPNPTVDKLHIKVKCSGKQTIASTLIDMSGKVYVSFTLPVTNELVTSIDLSTVPSGNYLLNVHDDNGGETHQLITVNH